MAETSKEITLRSAELNYQLPDASALIAEGEDARDVKREIKVHQLRGLRVYHSLVELL